MHWHFQHKNKKNVVQVAETKLDSIHRVNQLCTSVSELGLGTLEVCCFGVEDVPPPWHHRVAGGETVHPKSAPTGGQTGEATIWALVFLYDS